MIIINRKMRAKLRDMVRRYNANELSFDDIFRILRGRRDLMDAFENEMFDMLDEEDERRALRM